MLTYSEFSSLWRLPALHYEIPRLPAWIQIHATHTDTDVRWDLNGLQVASIRSAICAEGSPDRWRILFGHHPIYSSGHYRNDGQERLTRALIEIPLIAACGVHVYFAGHAHHQEHLTAPGFEQIIQGSAGKTNGSNRSHEDARMRQRYFSRTFGFAIATVDPGRLRIDFYDVLNTREKADEVVLLADSDVVRTCSWCGARTEIGRPDASPPPCPAERQTRLR